MCAWSAGVFFGDPGLIERASHDLPLHVSRRTHDQQPLFPVQMFVPKPLVPGSMLDMLARYGEVIIHRSDFVEADPTLGGRVGWCVVQLSKLVILQGHYGWTDRETVRRATMDMQVMACLGLGLGQKGPSQATLCRHRQRMQELGLIERYQERFFELLRAVELLCNDEAVLVDSVPIRGAGQTLDSYNLLAGSVRRGLKVLSRVQQRPVADVAAELGLSMYLDRSIKGQFKIDWSDEAARREVLSQLVADARRVREVLEGEQATTDDVTADAIVEASETIEDIIAQDVEFDDDGSVSGIRHNPGGDRCISLTDPEMRHGRKSASVLISGYKAQIVATVLYGFILFTKVIKANQHDGQDLPEIVDELKERGFIPPWWGGDHAYGTLANHRFFQENERGELVARMARPANGGRFTKDEFDYDFERKTLTCPVGLTVVQTRWTTCQGRKGRRFEFPSEQCGSCPKRERCVSPKAKATRGRSVFVVEDEERLIRKHLERRQEPEFQEKLKQRTHVERAIAGFAQCGGKQARRFGQANVDFDASISALTYNLRRLGSLMQRDSELAARVEAALRDLLLCLLELWAYTPLRPRFYHWLWSAILLFLATA